MVIILRGPSGAGKSTWAKHYFPHASVVSADHYFMVGDEYRFDPSKLPQAHAVCLRNFVDNMQSGVDITIVDNTNTTVAEVAPYAALALAYGQSLKIVTFDGDWRIAAQRNVHGVPESTVEAQASRIRDAVFPPWWPHETVDIR